MRPCSSIVFQPNKQYTVLVEIRNFQNSGTGAVYFRCPDGGQLRNLDGTATATDHQITDSTEEIRFEVKGYDYTAIAYLGMCIRNNAGSNASFDMRVSIYESAQVGDNFYMYTGAYKPYVPLKVVTATQRIYYRSKVGTTPAAPSK